MLDTKNNYTHHSHPVMIGIGMFCVVFIGGAFLWNSIVQSAPTPPPAPSVIRIEGSSVTEDQTWSRIRVVGENLALSGWSVSITDGTLAQVATGTEDDSDYYEYYVRDGTACSRTIIAEDPNSTLTQDITVYEPSTSVYNGSRDGSDYRASTARAGSGLCSSMFSGSFVGYLEQWQFDDNSCSSPTRIDYGWCEAKPMASSATRLTPSGVDTGAKIGSGDDVIKITGSQFYTSNVQVTLGGIVQPIVSSSNAEIRVKLNPLTPLCSKEITIQNLIPSDAVPDARKGVYGDFLVVPKVTGVAAVYSISGFSPDHGSSGTVVKLSGSFGPDRSALEVLFGADTDGSGGVIAPFYAIDKAWNPYDIYPLVPLSTSSGKIKIVACGGAAGATALSSSSFGVSYEPVIFYFNPNWGASAGPSKEFFVYGYNLNNAHTSLIQVSVNTTPARVITSGTSGSSGLEWVKIEVPTGATTGKIKVCTTIGCVTSQSDFYVQTIPSYQHTLGLPEFSSVTPRYHYAGVSVTIRGRNLGTQTYFGSKPAIGTLNADATQLVVTAPAGALDPLLVCNAKGCSSDHFAHEFLDYGTAKVDLPLLTHTSADAATVREQTVFPQSATAPSGACVANNPAPQVTNVSALSQYVGYDQTGKRNSESTLAISGCHFGPSTYKGFVLFNDTKQLDVISWSDTSIEVGVPFDATSGNLSVVAFTGQVGYSGRASASFAVNPTIQKLSPNHAVRKQIIDIWGSDFCGNVATCVPGEVRFGVYPGVEDTGVKATVFSWSNRRIRVSAPDDNGEQKDWGGLVKVIRSDGVVSHPLPSVDTTKKGSDMIAMLKQSVSYFYRLPRIFSLASDTVLLDQPRPVGFEGESFFGDKNINAKFIDPVKKMPTVDIYKWRIKDDSVNQGVEGYVTPAYDTRGNMVVPIHIPPGRQSVIWHNWDGAFAQARPSTRYDRLDLRSVAGSSIKIVGDTVVLKITGGFDPSSYLFGATLVSGVSVSSWQARPVSVSALIQTPSEAEQHLRSIQVVFPKQDADDMRFRATDVNVIHYTQTKDTTGTVFIEQGQYRNDTGTIVNTFESTEYNDISQYQSCSMIDDVRRCVLLYPGVEIEGSEFVGWGMFTNNPLIVKACVIIYGICSKNQTIITELIIA